MFHAHRWPGNVRELNNAVQRFLVMPERPLRFSGAAQTGAQSEFTPVDAPIQPLRVARREASDTFERVYLRKVLDRAGGNVTRAATLAEVSRQMVQKLMRKHALD